MDLNQKRRKMTHITHVKLVPHPKERKIIHMGLQERKKCVSNTSNQGPKKKVNNEKVEQIFMITVD